MPLRELNVEFLENYKRLDCLCKDSLSSEEGVSEYLRQMENICWEDRTKISCWTDDYQGLKHVRWVRNKLVHEVGAWEAGLCTIEELNYVKDFYERILKSKDSLSIARAMKESDSKPLADSQEQPSFWDRLVAKVKSFFKI